MHKESNEHLSKRLLPKIDRLLKVDLEYLKRTLKTQYKQLDTIEAASQEDSPLTSLNILQWHQQVIEKLDTWCIMH